MQSIESLQLDGAERVNCRTEIRLVIRADGLDQIGIERKKAGTHAAGIEQARAPIERAARLAILDRDGIAQMRQAFRKAAPDRVIEMRRSRRARQK
jgi:hypothetical protein